MLFLVHDKNANELVAFTCNNMTYIKPLICTEVSSFFANETKFIYILYIRLFEYFILLLTVKSIFQNFSCYNELFSLFAIIHSKVYFTQGQFILLQLWLSTITTMTCIHQRIHTCNKSDNFYETFINLSNIFNLLIFWVPTAFATLWYKKTVSSLICDWTIIFLGSEFLFNHPSFWDDKDNYEIIIRIFRR